MSKLAISIRGVSKRYQLGKQDMQFLSFMMRAWSAFRRKRTETELGGPIVPPSTLWALSDVSMEVRDGDVVGLVGKNGSGKSTLLKILSRITPPTTGEIDIYGRLGSLLEVGTGFHPELTGRENVFLNGTLLGMSRAEILAKLDEIIAFAEIEKFLDTPVKRYSSGMFVRLAFSVAAHLDTEILVLDEVLSVGDQSFTRKCLGKVSSVARSGRTCLVVSHNLPVIQNTCTRAVLLDGGKVLLDGSVTDVLQYYAEQDVVIHCEREFGVKDRAPEFPDGTVRLVRVRAVTDDGSLCDTLDLNEPFTVEVQYEVREPKHAVLTQLRLFNEVSQPLLCSMDTLDSPYLERPSPAGMHTVRCRLPAPLLNTGLLKIDVTLLASPSGSQAAACRDALVLNVREDRAAGGVRGCWQGEWPTAMVRPRLHWRHEMNDEALLKAG